MAPALGLVDLGVLLGLAFLIALSFTYRYTLGELLRQLAAAIGAIRVPFLFGGFRLLGFAADAILRIDNAIRHAIGVAIDGMKVAWNECMSYTAYAINEIGKEIASLAHDVAAAIETVNVTQVTNVYRKANPAIAGKLAALAATVAALEARIQHAAAVAVPDAIPVPADIGGGLTEALERIKGLTRRLAPAALVGVGAYALAKIGLTWIRCGRVSKVGKRICGMNDSALDNLLASTVLIVGTVSLVEFARGMQGIMDEVTEPVAEFWRATN